jgi:hypothetical protein
MITAPKLTRRTLTLALFGAALLTIGCSTTKRPLSVRVHTGAPPQPFTSVAVLLMPVSRPERTRPAMIDAYDRLWRTPTAWREPFARRLVQNFAVNGLALQVIDVGAGTRATVTPDTLLVQMTPKAIWHREKGTSIAMHVEATNRKVAYLDYEADLWLQPPEDEADLQTYLILNTLGDGGLVQRPPEGVVSYRLAPRS